MTEYNNNDSWDEDSETGYYTDKQNNSDVDDDDEDDEVYQNTDSDKEDTEENNKDNKYKNKKDSSDKDSNKDASTKDKLKSIAADKLVQNERVKRATEQVKNVQAALKSVGDAVKNFISIIKYLANPYVLAVLAVILIVFIVGTGIYSTAQVLGSNENVKCSVANSKSVPVGQPKDKTEAGNDIANWLMSTNFKFLNNKSMTKDMAGAIVGNFTQESQLDTSISNGGSFNASSTNDDIISKGGSAGATGLGQWREGRLIALGQFAKDHNGKWNDLQIQLEYFQKELDESYGAKLIEAGFKEGASVEDLTTSFNKVFEVSGEDNNSAANQARIKYAKDFLNTYKGGSSSNGSSSDGCANNGTAGSLGDVNGDGYMTVIGKNYGPEIPPCTDDSSGRHCVEVVDIYNMYWGECTSFASYMVNKEWGVSDDDQAAKKIIFSNNYKGVTWGNGGQWADAAKKVGIPTDDNPKPGDAAILYPTADNKSGHVAIVTEVFPDGTISVAEANYGTPGHKLGKREHIPVAGNFNTFIHFLDAKPS